MKIVKKLSAKVICGKIERPKEGDLDRALFDVYGQARMFESVTTPYGESLKFKGNFEAANAESGELLRSTILFLPDSAAELLAAAISGTEAGPVEFALKIGLAWSDNLIGYEYTIKPLVEPTADDPLTKMRAALSAPKTSTKKVTAKKEES